MIKILAQMGPLSAEFLGSHWSREIQSCLLHAMEQAGCAQKRAHREREIEIALWSLTLEGDINLRSLYRLLKKGKSPRKFSWGYIEIEGLSLLEGGELEVALVATFEY